MIEREPFGTAPDGTEASRYVLSSGKVRVAVSDFGATLLSLEAPDRDGRAADVVLGFDGLDGYAGENPAFFGGTVGPVANRTDRAEVPLRGTTYHLEGNDGPGGRNNNHTSSSRGLHKRRWEAEADEAANAVTLTCRLADGELGLPGNRTFRATYALGEKNGAAELRVSYRCESDAPHVRERDQPHLLQPRGERRGRRPGPHRPGGRRPVPLRARGLRPHRGGPGRGGDPVRLPPPQGARGRHRGRRRAAPSRARLRPLPRRARLRSGRPPAARSARTRPPQADASSRFFSPRPPRTSTRATGWATRAPRAASTTPRGRGSPSSPSSTPTRSTTPSGRSPRLRARESLGVHNRLPHLDDLTKVSGSFVRSSGRRTATRSAHRRRASSSSRSWAARPAPRPSRAA